MQHLALCAAGIALFSLCMAPDAAAARKNEPNNGTSTSQIFVSFAAQPPAISAGESVQLSWASSGADKCWASGGWEGRQDVAGIYTTQPLTASTSFNLTCGTKSSRTSVDLMVAVSASEPLSLAGSQQLVESEPTVQSTPTTETEAASEPQPTNIAPQAFAGEDTSVAAGTVLLVSGRIIDDGLPGPTVAASWSVTNAPAPTVIANPNALSTEVTFDAAGTYTLRLTADDGELQGFDEVTINVQPPPQPTLALSIDQAEVDPGSAVQLSWQAEHVDGCTASGDWDGPRPPSGATSVTVDAYATFSLTCTAGTETITRMASVLVRNIQLSWQAPTENVDGTPANDLAGFRVYSLNGGSYELEADLPSPDILQTALAKPSGSYDLRMTAYDLEGNESAYSNIVRKVSP